MTMDVQPEKFGALAKALVFDGQSVDFAGSSARLYPAQHGMHKLGFHPQVSMV